MKPLHIFNEEQISEEIAAGYKTRKAARVIVFDEDGNIALLYIRQSNYYELPGGGVEEGETFEQACVRECKEEIGCNVEILSNIGRILEYRKERERINDSFCFTAKVIGEKGLQELTEKELERGMETVWVSKEKAIELISERLEVLKETLSLYNKYVIERSLVFLNAM